MSGSGSIEQLLTAVAGFALQAVPGADGAGITMLQAGEPDTVVASEPFVQDVDDIQYRLGEEPCISAAATSRTTMSGALSMSAASGPNSATIRPRTAAQRLGELFAGPAAVAIHNARVLDQAQRGTARLERALTTRATIDRAVGIIMSRAGASADEAFVRLRIMSQHEHIKLSVVAARLLDDAARRARERRVPRSP